jgi:hypothetical protein
VIDLADKKPKSIEGFEVYYDKFWTWLDHRVKLKWVFLVVAIITIALVFFAGRASAHTPAPTHLGDESLSSSTKNHLFVETYAAVRPKRIYYLIDDGHRWCEPDNIMYNEKGYKIFNFEWLNTPCTKNRACWENKNQWATKIMAAKHG